MIDKIDRQIVSLLQAYARLSNAALAEKVGLTTSTVHERVKKLEKSGVIKKYVALVDQKTIGIETCSFVAVTISRHVKEAVEEFIKAVEEVDEVMECHHITGNADFLLKIAVKNIPAYEDLVLHKLTDLPHIQNIKTMVVLSTFKNETAFNIEGENNEKF